MTTLRFNYFKMSTTEEIDFGWEYYFIIIHVLMDMDNNERISSYFKVVEAVEVLPYLEVFTYGPTYRMSWTSSDLTKRYIQRLI